MFWLRNKKIIFSYILLTRGLHQSGGLLTNSIPVEFLIVSYQMTILQGDLVITARNQILKAAADGDNNQVLA